jgi:hypothetical protein
VHGHDNILENLVRRHEQLITAKTEILGILVAKQLAADRLDEEMEWHLYKSKQDSKS